MKILIIGNTCSTGWNLKKGLETYNEVERVDIVFDPHPTIDGYPSDKLLPPKEYDVVHYNYPFVKTYFKYKDYIEGAKKLVCHWRGTDIRLTTLKNPIANIGYQISQRLFIKYILNRADYHYYSTIDLRWFFKNISENKLEHIYSCVDVELFKPMDVVDKYHKQDVMYSKGGAKGYHNRKVDHSQMPFEINKFRAASITPAENIDPNILSVSAMECLACGLSVEHHLDKDREWVVENTSIEVIAQKVITKYISLLNTN